MTRKEMQKHVNTEIENALAEYNSTAQHIYYGKQLRSCNAVVYETDRYVVLKSYSTVVAFIDKENSTMYDILRYVYGYTATSAQHIAKFRKDYPTLYVMTWRYPSDRI